MPPRVLPEKSPQPAGKRDPEKIPRTRRGLFQKGRARQRGKWAHRTTADALWLPRPKSVGSGKNATPIQILPAPRGSAMANQATAASSRTLRSISAIGNQRHVTEKAAIPTQMLRPASGAAMERSVVTHSRRFFFCSHNIMDISKIKAYIDRLIVSRRILDNN